MKKSSISIMVLILLASVILGACAGDAGRASLGASQTYTPETIRMATMITVILPIIFIYPFLQKYFVKGIMVGSIKE